jgi:hypothetical protein
MSDKTTNDNDNPDRTWFATRAREALERGEGLSWENGL